MSKKTSKRLDVEVQVRLPAALVAIYKDIAEHAGVSVETALLVTLAMKVVADKNRDPLP